MATIIYRPRAKAPALPEAHQAFGVQDITDAFAVTLAITWEGIVNEGSADGLAALAFQLQRRRSGFPDETFVAVRSGAIVTDQISASSDGFTTLGENGIDPVPARSAADVTVDVALDGPAVSDSVADLWAGLDGAVFNLDVQVFSVRSDLSIIAELNTHSFPELFSIAVRAGAILIAGDISGGRTQPRVSLGVLT